MRQRIDSDAQPATGPLRHQALQHGHRPPVAPWQPAEASKLASLHPESMLRLQRSVGNTVVQRLVRLGSTTPASGGQHLVQRFGSGEHKSLGDTASGGAVVNVGGETPTERFELTYGDMIALSGDYFDPHELMDLARLPGRQGSQPGTRDEIVFALREALGSGEPRFGQRGLWTGWTFEQSVIDAVQNRYKLRAAANTPHFGAPRGRDAGGAPNPPAPSEGSAGSTYHSLHEEALWLAYNAAASGEGSLPHAMAMEAAAGHFLTDAFSAGHVRTPVGEIRDYWGAKYPLFWFNLRHKIALDTAIAINAQDTNAATVLGSVQAIYDNISAEVEALAMSLPAVTLGDLLAKVFHDWDNEHGLDLQGGGRLYGDEHLDQATGASGPQNVTRSRAEAAMRAGIADVRAAHTVGQSERGLSREDVVVRVIGPTTGPTDQFAAEQLLPRPEASNPAQNWRAPDLEGLWDQPIVAGASQTVGDRIIQALNSEGEIRDQLEDLAGKFKVSQPVRKGGILLGTVHPRRAYRTGFLNPLLPGSGNPRAGVLSIAHWAPNYGLADHDRDDVSLATGQSLARGVRRGENLRGMTTPARVSYIRELIGGSVASDEEQLVVRIFQEALASERAAIYQALEGHAWNGDWVHGVFTDDDELWNALSRDRLRRLRIFINEGR